MDCKKALTESSGDIDNAVDILRKKGVASAAKKAGRAANEACTRFTEGMRLLGPALSGRGSQLEWWIRRRQVRPLGSDDHAPTGLVRK